MSMCARSGWSFAVLSVAPLLQFLDLVAKQSDYLSTVIGGLTVELSCGRYDGAVIVRREALQVSYRVEGGEGGAAGGYKVLGMMNWSQIVRWSLVHQVSVWRDVLVQLKCSESE